MPSFIVTLGTLEASRGLAYLVTNSQTKYLSGKLELLVRPIGSPMITAAMSLTVAAVAILAAACVVAGGHRPADDCDRHE